jgi:Ala-tRNA(Pro) deacylase
MLMKDLDRFLGEHEIHLERHEHPAVMTVEEADRLVPPLPAAKTKNLFLRDKKGRRHALVAVPSHCAVDLNALAGMIGYPGIGFASAERLAKHLGVDPGSVTILALANDPDHAVEFYIDRALWEADAVQAHPLVNTATMVVPHEALERFVAATGHHVNVVDVPRRAESND